MDFDSEDLPDGWIATNLGHLIHPSKEKVEPTTVEETTYIGLEHIESQTGRLVGHGVSSDVRSTKSVFKRGDLLYGKLRPYLNKVYLSELDGICSTDILVFPKSENLSCQYLTYQFLSDDLVQYANANSTGVQHPRIKFESLSKFSVPLPPLNEQRRIVAKIEELTAHSRRAREALDDVPTLIDQFRQSVLAAAFRGDLTADWREKNPDVEPAEKLLERIRVERRQRWEENCKIAVNKGQRKPRAPKENHEEIKTDSLPSIPLTWYWERLVNLSDLLGGVTKGRKFNGRTTLHTPYLRVANVQDGFLDLEEIKKIEVLPEDVDKYQLETGDILFTEGGDRDKLGRGTVWLNEIEGCIHQNHVYRARLHSSQTLPEYISLAAKSEYSKGYFFSNASQTVNLASINITTLGKLPLPIPPIAEQKIICDRVHQVFKVIDYLCTNRKDVIEEVDTLDQSILAKAFRGELVPQVPNDEPASVLLNRIRAEREKLGSTQEKGHSTRKQAKQDSSEQPSL